MPYIEAKIGPNPEFSKYTKIVTDCKTDKKTKKRHKVRCPKFYLSCPFTDLSSPVDPQSLQAPKLRGKTKQRLNKKSPYGNFTGFFRLAPSFAGSQKCLAGAEKFFAIKLDNALLLLTTYYTSL